MDILRGTIPHTGNEVFDGHRGDKDISCYGDVLPFRIATLDFGYLAVLDCYTLYATSEPDTSAHLGNFISHMFPQLAGSVFRVEKRLYKGGLDFLLFYWSNLGKHVLHKFRDG